MAHGKKRRGHRSSGVAAGVTGPASCLHSVHSHRLASGVETHPPNRHESASIWNRRLVLEGQAAVQRSLRARNFDADG